MKATNLFLAALCSLSLAFSNLEAQQPAHDELYSQIATMDSLLFDAFNNCQLEKLKTFFSPDLEFFHDTGGLSHYDENMESIKDLCTSGRKVRRELVPGSMRVYPIPGYGAIQEASHHFYATEIDEEEQWTGTFKFLHIWKQENGHWLLARVVSYGH